MNRPNILLLFADQQRHDTIGALGNEIIQTPALDSLAREGVAFTSAYTPAPVCVAARCSLVLSQWPHQTGCDANGDMPQDRTSLMELLADAGYQTHGTGKMHFVPDSHALWGFEARDYSEECGMQPDDDYHNFLRENGCGHLMDPQGLRSEHYYLPQPAQMPARLHVTQWVGDRSLEFLQTRDRSRPFFLWTSFIKPHPPFDPPAPWYRLYRPTEMPLPHLPPGYEDLLSQHNHGQNASKWRNGGTDWNLVRTQRAAYYASISFVDYQIGRILSALRESGELDNTLVIHTSDHGEMLGDFGCWGKRTMLDAAQAIPLLARYPAAFRAGERCGALASLVDVMPTCLDLAGLPVPDSCVGERLTTLAEGGSKRAAVLTQYGREGRGLYSLIREEYRYVYSAGDRREWLFDRRHRPEQRDLAATPTHRQITRSMREELIAWFRRDGYELPLEGEGWRHFPQTPPPVGLDSGLMYQDGCPTAELFPEGYCPRYDPSAHRMSWKQ